MPCGIWNCIEPNTGALTRQHSMRRQAGPAVVREVTQSITQWEPRVKVLSVISTPMSNITTQPGAHIEITVAWQLNLGGAPSPARSTTVTLASAGQPG